ncbi:MAG: hypothetical protein H6622_07430 [Halobacteriovoraceae bacterium]|nr:hypothetical protein [Halobacteriovoraceae bacterium]
MYFKEFKKLISLCVFFSLSLALNANETDYFNQIGNGEKKKPDQVFEEQLTDQYLPYTGELKTSTGHFFLDNYFKYVLPQSKELNDYELQGIKLFLNCPRDIFNRHFEYIRYLYRLIFISYQHLVIKSNGLLRYTYKQDVKQCQYSWEQIFKNCQPKYIEMQKFLKRIKSSDALKEEYIKFPQSINGNLKDILKEQINPLFEISHEIIKSSCSDKNCSGQTVDEINKILGKSCEDAKSNISYVCNEIDNFYAFNNYAFLTEILKESGPMSVIDEEGYAENCMDEFSSLFRTRYQTEGPFEFHLESIHKYLLKNYPEKREGELFIAGALKKFDDKGLEDFLFAINEKVITLEKKEEVVKKVKKEIKLPLKVIPIVNIPPPKKDPPKKIVDLKLPEPPRRSEFYRATQKLRNNNLELVDVNMSRFKSDFVFSKKMIEKLDYPVKIYMTRAALTDMKKLDHLGSKNEPVRLLFLKYMIDHNFHQGLFNVQAILGTKFYVLNDIDLVKGDIPALVEIQNDETTNSKWKIKVLKETLKK